MKAMIILPMLAIAIALAGCSQPAGDDIPPYDPGGIKPQDIADTPTVAPNQSAPSDDAPPVWDQPADDGTTLPEDAPAVVEKPVVVAPNKTADAGTGGACAAFSGDQLISCVAQQATDAKDVTICTQLADKDMRYKCINKWCSSSGRDYRLCSKLTDYNDRTGCLNKCNPNANT